LLCEVYEVLRSGVLLCLIGGLHHLHRSEAGSIVDKGQVSSAPEECRSFMSGRPSQTPEHDEQMQGGNLGRKDFWRKMFKSQSAASDTSSQSEQDVQIPECSK